MWQLLKDESKVLSIPKQETVGACILYSLQTNARLLIGLTANAADAQVLAPSTRYTAYSDNEDALHSV